jgi:hypothetical protein
MWRKEKQRVKVTVPVKGASAEMLAMVMQEAGEDAEIEAATERQEMMQTPMGPAPVVVYDAKIKRYEERSQVKVEAFPPEELLVKRDWTSPMLQDCPYVARSMLVTLSELHEMGYTDVTVDDLEDSNDANVSVDKSFRETRRAAQDGLSTLAPRSENDDESQAEGYLRIEYALVDYDGDGIAERRCIYRLKNKILKNEEAEEVPFATASPILNPHRWDGLSLAETVSDLQKLRTELTRQMVNSAVLANNPRTKVLTTADGAPLANIDDLLTAAPGRILRQRQTDAIQEHITPWVGGQMFPMLEYIDFMREQRTGVSRAQQGIDANALRHDRTAAEVTQTANAAAARIELIARIFAETLLKPIFKGILRLLTEGDMQKVAFRLRNEFVEYDPQEWRDGYDMTINVGLGTGDKNQQAALLQAIFAQQGAIAASPVGSLLVKPKHIYSTVSKIVENAGFKNVGDFYDDPGDQPTPQGGPPPELLREQAKGQVQLQVEAQRNQLTIQSKRAELQLQAANDARDSERERMRAEMDAQIKQLDAQYRDQQHAREMEFQRWKAELDAAVKIQVAQLSAQVKAENAATAATEAEIQREVK